MGHVHNLDGHKGSGVGTISPLLAIGVVITPTHDPLTTNSVIHTQSKLFMFY